MLSKLLVMAAGAAAEEDYWLATFEQASYTVVPYDMAVGSDRSIYIVGQLTSGANFRSFLIKYLEDGTVSWQRELGVGDIFVGGAQLAYSVTLDSSGNVYVVGQSTSDGGAFIHSYTANGTARWKRYLDSGGSGDDSFMGIAADNSGNVYAAGWAHLSSTGLVLAKYNSSGVLQFQKELGAGTDRGEGIASDGNGNFYVAGANVSGSDFRPLLVKYNSSGTVQWQRVTDVGVASCRAYNAAATSNSVYFATSKRESFLLKYDTSGNLLWQRTLTGWASSTLEPGVAVDLGENAYLAVTSHFVKYNASGTLQWQREITGVGDYRAIKHLGKAIYVIGGNSAKGFIAKVPDDGSLTGTYGGFTYQAASLTSATGTATSSTSSLAASNTTATDATGAIPDNAGTLTSTKVDV